MTVLDRFEVPAGVEPERFDRLAHRVFPALATRAAARKAIKRGEVLLDGIEQSPSRWVVPGMALTLVESTVREPPRYDLATLRILYEDDHMAVVEKPPGLRINGVKRRTLEHALPGHLTPSPVPDALRWPRPAHRLDAPTGGLVAIGKSGSGLAELSEAFHQRRVTKRYRAIAIGRLEGTGEVREPLDGRDAHTTWTAVRHVRSLRPKWVTVVDLVPHTGRTHQLRRHLFGLGHPILGDRQYAVEGQLLRGKGLFLWAVELGVPHPVTGERVHVEIGVPAKFESLLRREQRRWNTWHDGTDE